LQSQKYFGRKTYSFKTKMNFILLVAATSWKNAAYQIKKINTNLKLKFTIKIVMHPWKGIQDLDFISLF